MDLKRENSLDEWVWIKDKAFTVSENDSIPTFFVEWNNFQKVFAVTCRRQSRVANDETDQSNTDTFSLPAIFNIHRTLCGINKQMPELPNLPKEPRGFKAMLYGGGVYYPRDMEKHCTTLQDYLLKVANTVGVNILQQVSFCYYFLLLHMTFKKLIN